MDCYLVGKQEDPRCIIYSFPDVFGVRTGRHVRICDQVAEAVPGSLVCMPDILHGKPIAEIYSSQFTFRLFGTLPLLHAIRYRCGAGAVIPDVELVMAAMERRLNASPPRLMMGFCWGGWLAFKLCESAYFVGAVGFHPSVMANSLQQKPYCCSEENFAKSIRAPLLICAAGNDEPTIKEGGQFFKTVKENNPGSRTIEYKDMLHGWVNRGTEPDCVVKQKCAATTVSEAQQSAVEEAVAFFQELLSKEPSTVPLAEELVEIFNAFEASPRSAQVVKGGGCMGRCIG